MAIMSGLSIQTHDLMKSITLRPHYIIDINKVLTLIIIHVHVTSNKAASCSIGLTNRA